MFNIIKRRTQVILLFGLFFNFKSYANIEVKYPKNIKSLGAGGTYIVFGDCESRVLKNASELAVYSQYYQLEPRITASICYNDNFYDSLTAADESSRWTTFTFSDKRHGYSFFRSYKDSLFEKLFTAENTKKNIYSQLVFGVTAALRNFGIGLLFVFNSNINIIGNLGKEATKLTDVLKKDKVIKDSSVDTPMPDITTLDRFNEFETAIETWKNIYKENKTVKNLEIGKAEINLQNFVVAPFSFAFKLSESFSVGVAVKYFTDINVSNFKIDANIVDYKPNFYLDCYINSYRNIFSISNSYMFELPNFVASITLNDILSFINSKKCYKINASSFSIFDEEMTKDEKLDPNIGFGIGKYIELNYYLLNSINFVLELDHIFTNNKNYQSFHKKLHLGSELKIDPFSGLSLLLRAGINEGYFTYGATLNLLYIFELQFASYTEELGNGFRKSPNNLFSIEAGVHFLRAY